MAKHNEYGKESEKTAIKFLKKQGYRILEKNFKVKHGEVDIIALETKKARKKRVEDYNKMTKNMQKENVVCFIEVKSRNNLEYGRPSEAVDYKKLNHYQNAKDYYFLTHKKYNKLPFRFDIIEIVEERVDNYIINGF